MGVVAVTKIVLFCVWCTLQRIFILYFCYGRDYLIDNGKSEGLSTWLTTPTHPKNERS